MRRGSGIFGGMGARMESEFVLRSFWLGVMVFWRDGYMLRSTRSQTQVSCTSHAPPRRPYRRDSGATETVYAW